MNAHYRQYIHGDKAVIPDGVTRLDDHAFHDCRTLREILLPDSLESIGDFCFSNCQALISIHIPAGVTSIGEGLFSGCSALGSITVSPNNPCYRSLRNCILSKDGELLVAGCKYSTIPDRVRHIGKQAFSSCTGLEDIRIPGGVESIGDFAFVGCSALTRIHIPASVTAIGEGILSDCTNMESISVSPANPCYRSFNNCLLSKDGKDLIGGCCNSVIPEGVETIGAWAFSGFPGLGDFRIPDGVIEIREGAFCECPGLRRIVIPEGVLYIGDRVFEDCSDLETIVLPDSVEFIGEDAFSGCTSLISIKIPKGMTHVDVKHLLSHCSSLKSIEFPENVRDINLHFSDMPALESISVSTDNPYYQSFANCLFSKDGKQLIAGCRTPVFPEGVEIIGERAFSGLPELEDIRFPDSVKKIEDYAFEKCSGLKRITIGASVTEIGEHAFSDCSALESISVSPDNSCYRSIGNCLLSKDGTQLMVGSNTSTIPGTVTHIWEGAFKGRSGLDSISIPQDVTCIGDRAFSDCTALTCIHFPAQVTSIGQYILSGCSALRNISVSSENPVYSAIGNCLLSKDGKELISGCSTSSIPDCVERIADRAFWGQKRLFSIVIPSSVKSIGKIAFFECTNIFEVWINDKLESVGAWAFAKCPNLRHIIVEPDLSSHEVDMGKVAGLFSRAFPNHNYPQFIPAASRPSGNR